VRAPIARRLLLVPPTLIGITLCTFLLVHLAPGDPATVRAGNARGVSPASVAELRREFELDRPLGARYLSWLARSARLDFGVSFSDGRPVRARIAEALPRTLALALAAALGAWLVGVPLGCLLGACDRRRWARWAEAALYLAYALPAAAVAMWLLSVGAGFGGRDLGTLAPAAACLALPLAVKLSRYQRGALVSALDAEYVRTAEAKGADRRTVVLRHALANALLPTVTLLGSELPSLLSGSVIVEQVFGVRGLGLCAFDAVLARDYPMLLGLTTLAALLTLGGMLAADVAYGLVDPRLRGRST
jgi:peptide/nickel transport system permease protein